MLDVHYYLISSMSSAFWLINFSRYLGDFRIDERKEGRQRERGEANYLVRDGRKEGYSQTRKNTFREDCIPAERRGRDAIEKE